MDSSRVVLALQEQEKWRDRRKRVEERIRHVKAQKRYVLKELDAVRQKVARFGAALGVLKGRVAPTPETRLTAPDSLR
jgi:hypothetical protein